MQLIANALKTLFVSNDCSSILKELLNPQSSSLDKYVNKNYFVHLQRMQSDAYSIDQLDGAYNILVSKWMKAEESFLIKYANEDSIFNLLLHFCKDVLRLDNNIPVSHYEELLPWHIVSSQIGEDVLTSAYLASIDLRTGADRQDFTWAPFISTDNAALEALFKKPMCDIHNHLKGLSIPKKS